MKASSLGVLCFAIGLIVSRWVPPAHADVPKVSCETLYFEWDFGQKRGRANIDAYRAQIEGLISAKQAAGFVRPLYSASFPILSPLNHTVVAEGGVMCFGTLE